MKSYQVIRTHISPYQAQDFTRKEAELLTNLEGIEYVSLQEAGPDKPTILITNTHTVLKDLPQDLLAQTKLIVHPNSGYDELAKDRSLWENIPVVIGHEIRAGAVVEYTIGCLFDSQDRPQHKEWHKDRTWERKLIKGSRILILGHGHIGKKLCEILHALGASLTVVDPYIHECPFHHFDTWQDADLEDFDVVMCALSLNESSKNILNKNFFSGLQKDVIFINAARGGLYDEEALREFFSTHPKARAYLDVFPEEPFKQTWNLPNIFATSHIAGVHRSLDQGILEFEFNVLEDFLSMSREEFKSFYRNELLQNKIIEGIVI